MLVHFSKYLYIIYRFAQHYYAMAVYILNMVHSIIKTYNSSGFQEKPISELIENQEKAKV